MKTKFSATIPVMQYGNIVPEIELEGKNFEALREEGMEYIKKMWDTYGEKPFPKQGNFKEFTTFTGEKILYDELQHVYTDMAGNKLVSGSEYAKSIIGEFNTDLLSGKVAEKYGVAKETVQKMWALSGDISSTFGTALHLAMEQWFLHREFGTEKEYHLPKPDYLRKAVMSFPLQENTMYPEVMISDVANKMCGQVDGLDRTEIGYHIIDYKSDSDVRKNMKKHTIQLNFYRKILENKGFKISGMSIWNYVNEWVEYPIEVIEI